MPKRKNVIFLSLVGVGSIGLLLLLFLYNPQEVPFYPRCPIYMLSGYQCPGCGSLRAIHALLHGQIVQAWHYNSLLFFAIPAVAYYFTLIALRRKYAWAEHLYIQSGKAIVQYLFVLFVLLWVVVRNW